MEPTSRGLSRIFDILYCMSTREISGTILVPRRSEHTSKFCEAARGLLKICQHALPVSTQILMKAFSRDTT